MNSYKTMLAVLIVIHVIVFTGSLWLLIDAVRRENTADTRAQGIVSAIALVFTLLAIRGYFE